MHDVPVLLVGNFLSATRGSRGVCEELALRLCGAGCPVLTTSNKPGRLERLLDMVTTSWRQRHEYAVAQVDVYSGPAFTWAESVCWTLRRASRPYVLTLHGGNLPTFAQRQPQRVRRLLASASAITTPSRFLLGTMQPYCEELLLLPNALDVDAYRYRLRERAQPNLVWLRTFHETYNPELAPRVLAKLSAEFPELRLIMVGRDHGDGSLQRTRRTAEALGVLDCIEFPGGVPKGDVPAWLARGDIFLNTTNVDNTPVSVLEAMASGLCVVSTNVGGLPYLIRDSEEGLLVPPDNPEAMAEAIRRILHCEELARRLSAAGREAVEQMDWSAILPRWQALLRSVAEGKSYGAAEVEAA